MVNLIKLFCIKNSSASLLLPGKTSTQQSRMGTCPRYIFIIFSKSFDISIKNMIQRRIFGFETTLSKNTFLYLYSSGGEYYFSMSSAKEKW